MEVIWGRGGRSVARYRRMKIEEKEEQTSRYEKFRANAVAVVGGQLEVCFDELEAACQTSRGFQ